MSAFSFWDWLDLIGLTLVFFGVLGTSVLLFIRSPKFSYDETDLIPESHCRSMWECRNKRLEKLKHRWEVGFEIILVVGLALELWAMPNHMKEAAESNERAKQLESANLQLRKQLESRRLSGDEKRSLASHLSLTELSRKPNWGAYPSNWIPGIFVVSATQDPEAADFAGDFIEACQMAGWNAWTNKLLLNPNFGVSLHVMPSTPPDLPGLQELRNGLHSLGIEYRESPITEDEAGYIGMSVIQESAIYLYVERKPFLLRDTGK